MKHQGGEPWLTTWIASTREALYVPVYRLTIVGIIYGALVAERTVRVTICVYHCCSMQSHHVCELAA